MVLWLLFLFWQGADPILEVANLAKRLNFSSGKYHNVSLGQGQDKIAMKFLEIAHKQVSRTHLYYENGDCIY